MTIFLSLSTSPYRLQSQRKVKTIEHATIKNNLTVFIKYRMIYAWISPKFWENGLQSLKMLENDHFPQVWEIFYADLDLKRKKTVGNATSCSTFIISCNSNHLISWKYKPPLNLQKNWGKRTKTVKNTYYWPFFISLSTPLFRTKSPKKAKTIRHGIISHSPIICAWTCPKPLGNGLQRAENNLKMIVFHKFEDSSMSTLIIKENRNKQIYSDLLC